MSQGIAEIVSPLVERGLFDNAEIAVKNLMKNYVINQIQHYKNIIHKFEKKYGMNYNQFNNYLEVRAKKLSNDKSIHKNLMLEEEDAIDWKIANDMLESWLGIKDSSV